MNSSQKAINSACRMLGIREHSEKQIRTKLIKKGFDNNQITETIDFLYRESWLSNERFCGSFIRSRVSKGHGKIRIEFELLQNELSQNLIDEAFDEEDVNWQVECVKVLRKKILSLFSSKIFGLETILESDKNSTNRKIEFEDKLKIERFMKYRGFEYSQIRSAFSQLKIKN